MQIIFFIIGLYRTVPLYVQSVYFYLKASTEMAFNNFRIPLRDHYIPDQNSEILLEIHTNHFFITGLYRTVKLSGKSVYFYLKFCFRPCIINTFVFHSQNIMCLAGLVLLYLKHLPLFSFCSLLHFFFIFGSTYIIFLLNFYFFDYA